MTVDEIAAKSSTEEGKVRKEKESKPLIFLGFLFVISGCFGVKYYISDYFVYYVFREHEEFFLVIFLSYIFPIILYFTLLWQFDSSGGKNELKENILLILLIISSLSGLYRAFNFIYYDINIINTLKDFSSLFYKPYLYIATWSTILFLSWLAFFMRCQQRTLYGIIEMFFGMATTMLSSFPIVDIFYEKAINDIVISSLMQLFFQIVGGIYIVVRGLDNIDNGIYRESNAKSIIKARAIREKLFGKKK